MREFILLHSSLCYKMESTLRKEYQERSKISTCPFVNMIIIPFWKTLPSNNPNFYDIKFLF